MMVGSPITDFDITVEKSSNTKKIAIIIQADSIFQGEQAKSAILRNQEIAKRVIGASHSIIKALDHWGMEDFSEELKKLIEDDKN